MIFDYKKFYFHHINKKRSDLQHFELKMTNFGPNPLN